VLPDLLPLNLISKSCKFLFLFFIFLDAVFKRKVDILEGARA